MGLHFSPSEAVTAGQVQFSIEFKDWDVEGDRGNSVGLFGWCVSASGRPLQLLMQRAGITIASALLTIERPDVVSALSSLHVPLLSGFLFRLSKFVFESGASALLSLIEEQAGGASAIIPLGNVSITSRELELDYQELSNPLLVVGMGRSGTSYMMRLLAGHPDILVPGDHPYEMRLPVWLWQAATVLSTPASPGSTHPDEFEASGPEWLGFNPYRSRDWEKTLKNSNVTEWQENAFPRSAIDFCKAQTDQFVNQYCVEGRIRPRYVAQKMILSPARYLVHNVYKDFREIFLVRDFRDIWLSARDFNRRRGTASFGQAFFEDEESWMRGLGNSSRHMRLAHAEAGPQAVTIKYEDLLADGDKCLALLLGRLGLTADAELVSQMRVDTALGRSDVLTHRTSRFGDGCFRWKQELGTRELHLANEVFADDLKYFGYDV